MRATHLSYGGDYDHAILRRDFDIVTNSESRPFEHRAGQCATPGCFPIFESLVTIACPPAYSPSIAQSCAARQLSRSTIYRARRRKVSASGPNAPSEASADDTAALANRRASSSPTSAGYVDFMLATSLPMGLPEHLFGARDVQNIVGNLKGETDVFRRNASAHPTVLRSRRRAWRRPVPIRGSAHRSCTRADGLSSSSVSCWSSLCKSMT